MNLRRNTTTPSARIGGRPAPVRASGTFSGVVDFAVAADFLRSLAKRKPISPGLTNHPRFIVVPETAGYGLMRMFQIAGESARPGLHVVRTVDEALTALGAQSPRFEPLE